MREISQYAQPQQQRQQQQQQQFTFKHPFTCIVSGPTSCGKTYFLSHLLERAYEKIEPPPQRIIFVYKRWQSLYDIIQKSVYPKVEFIRGVPWNLDREEFLDLRTRNLIVLDDMATEAAKDERVTDLFTEGSHHRNLSVIALNQNLYYSKDPTQRRNCHYMVLFNNVIDRQCVRTLARQMYPNEPQRLLRHFEDAVARPYGYLLIDLKPTTPELLRMRTDVLGASSEGRDAEEKAIADIPESTMDQPKVVNWIPQSDIRMTCDDCGSLLSDIHHLQNHVKIWCPLKRKAELRDDERVERRPRLENTDGSFEDDVTEFASDDESMEETFHDEITTPVVQEAGIEMWRRHFQRMAEGRVRPNHNGHYIVEKVQAGGESRVPVKFVTSVDRDIALAKSMLNLNEKGGQPEIQFVTPIARDIELAKSELKKRDYSMRPPGIPFYSGHNYSFRNNAEVL